jgi:hypothetical protein
VSAAVFPTAYSGSQRATPAVTTIAFVVEIPGVAICAGSNGFAVATNVHAELGRWGFP